MPATRGLVLALAACMLGAALSGGAAAQTVEPGLVRLAGPCSAQPGSTVVFDVQAVNFTSAVAAVQGTVTFDPTALQLVDVTAPANGPFSGGPRVSREPAAGEIRFAALDCSSMAPGTEIPVAARLRFQVLASAGAGLTLGLADVVTLDEDGSALASGSAGASLLVYELPDRDCDGVADSDDNCPDLANPDQTDTNANGIGDDCEPLFAELISFKARRWGRGAALITWETAAEVGTTGFYLSRGPSPAGPWTRLNESPIPAAGDETTGASYEFVDRQKPIGRVYYLLEAVGPTGGLHAFAPIDLRGPNDRDPRLPPQAPPAGARAGGGS